MNALTHPTELPLRHLPLEQIAPDPEQPRKDFDPTKLDRLADSIERHGVLQQERWFFGPYGWVLKDVRCGVASALSGFSRTLRPDFGRFPTLAES